MSRKYIISDSPMENFNYFIEWGAKSWSHETFYAINKCIGEETIVDKEVLDIGFRSGRISSLFALLGAKVTDVDLLKDYFEEAEREAVKHGVSDRTKFLIYDGNLDVFPDESFDIIFTKTEWQGDIYREWLRESFYPFSS